jgi:transcriptional regulator with XRE-family HTH domain
MMHESLPGKLRVLRARQGLTLIEAAEKVGIGRDTLSDLERGNRHPVMPTLAKIAKGYGVPVDELLEEPALTGPKAPPRARRGGLAKQVRKPLRRSNASTTLRLPSQMAGTGWRSVGTKGLSGATSTRSPSRSS